MSDLSYLSIFRSLKNPWQTVDNNKDLQLAIISGLCLAVKLWKHLIINNSLNLLGLLLTKVRRITNAVAKCDWASYSQLQSFL